MGIILGCPTTIASIDVDAQNCFTPLCPKELPVPDGQAIVNELNQQAKFAKWRIGSKDSHPDNAVWIADAKHPTLSPIKGKNVDVRWPKHAVPGTLGFASIKGLPHPSEYDFFVWKGVEPDMHPYGACYHDLDHKLSTGLIEFLNLHNVETVIVGGLATDYCVKDTVLQLAKAGLKIILNLAACRGLNPDTTAEAIKLMQEKGIQVIESSDSLQQNSEALDG